jgi:hypothetical protein
MKCDDCLNLLEEYIDGEATERDAEQISAHLITCAGCTSEFEALTAEQDILARYDRELDVTPAMWTAIQARTAVESRPVVASSKFNPRAWLIGLFAAPRFGMAFSGAMAVLIAAIVIGFMYLRTQPQPSVPQVVVRTTTPGPISPPPIYNVALLPPTTGDVNQRVASQYVPRVNALATPAKSNVAIAKTASATDQNDVLFSDIAYSDIENKDTADHIAQAENLLRSIRSIHLGDNDDQIDVTYEKAMSRRLLDQNVVLRRDAEMSGKFPVKSLLGDLEPFLVDIANLPDKTTPTELRAIKDRVQKTEIVAALQSY